MYVFQKFPGWYYHPSEQARIFNSEAEVKAAGPGWVDSPEKIGADDPEDDENNETSVPSQDVDKPDPATDESKAENDASPSLANAFGVEPPSGEPEGPIVADEESSDLPKEWNDLRTYAASKGINVKGKTRDEIEKELSELT